MNWIIDLILIASVVITIILYTCRGFIKSFFGLCKYAISFLFAYLLAPAIGKLISGGYISDTVRNTIYNWLDGLLQKEGGALASGDVISAVPEGAAQLLEMLGLNVTELAALYEGKTVNEALVTEITDSIAPSISAFISNAIAFIGIFIISVIALSIVAYILDKMCKLPGLREINKAFGCILGVVCAFINLFFICTLITVILSIAGLNDPNLTVEYMNENTIIYRFINNSNILDIIINALKKG